MVDGRTAVEGRGFVRAGKTLLVLIPNGDPTGRRFIPLNKNTLGSLTTLKEVGVGVVELELDNL